MSIVRENLMTQKGYTPYCGEPDCHIMPRTFFDGEQFNCPLCHWKSEFDEKFIKEYKAKWRIKCKT